MKKLLLAFALIGFIATSSYASTTTIETSAGIEFCEDDKKCDKKGCKHDKKATASKKSCSKGKKSCCASKGGASKKANGKTKASKDVKKTTTNELERTSKKK